MSCRVAHFVRVNSVKIYFGIGLFFTFLIIFLYGKQTSWAIFSAKSSHFADFGSYMSGTIGVLFAGCSLLFLAYQVHLQLEFQKSQAEEQSKIILREDIREALEFNLGLTKDLYNFPIIDNQNQKITLLSILSLQQFIEQPLPYVDDLINSKNEGVVRVLESAVTLCSEMFMILEDSIKAGNTRPFLSKWYACYNQYQRFLTYLLEGKEDDNYVYWFNCLQNEKNTLIDKTKNSDLSTRTKNQLMNILCPKKTV